MSTTTNIITSMQAFLHNKGANTSDARDTVSSVFNQWDIAINTYGDNFIGSYAPTVNCKLVGANICTANAVIIGNTSGNFITYTVNTNGVTAATLNCEADLAANIAVNSVQALTVNTANSFVDAGEIVLITVSTEAAADSNVVQHMTLRFEAV